MTRCSVGLHAWGHWQEFTHRWLAIANTFLVLLQPRGAVDVTRHEVRRCKACGVTQARDKA